jgi:hypothetical protein
MKFDLEKWESFSQEAMPLFYKHWKEIGKYQDIKLNVDMDKYQKLQDLGTLKCFTVRDNENKLIGYSIFFVSYNPHYKDSLQAQQDVLFIHPERRGFGAKFIKWCDEELKKLGVQAVYHHVKKEHNFGPLLEKFGYELVDLIYARRLDL